MIRTYKYRLYPTDIQTRSLERIVEICRHWYNMCLSERKYAYESEGESVNLYDQLRNVKRYKDAFTRKGELHSHILQVTTADVDKAYQAFFRRVKNGDTPGYPRFKGYGWFDSFGLKEYGNGFKVDRRRLKISGVGRIAVRWHREIDGKIKALRVIRKSDRWYACIACEVEPKPIPLAGENIGIDVGISNLITFSNGDKIDNPKWYVSGQSELRRLQRKLSRAKKGSNNYYKKRLSVQRQHEQVSNQRHDFLHKLSLTTVRDYDTIVVEELQVRNMVRNKRFSKSIADGGWSTFTNMLSYKAESAGKRAVFVKPHHTSDTCSNCGKRFGGVTLKSRWVTCTCGLSLDRDHNAAINILNRVGRDTPVLHNVGQESVRAIEATRF